mgnify:CR=1 FL=1
MLAGVLVTVGEGSAGIVPSLLVAGACVCCGLDNSLTALIDSLTPQETTFFKGVIAGSVNTAIGMLAVKSLPAAGLILAALAELSTRYMRAPESPAKNEEGRAAS